MTRKDNRGTRQSHVKRGEQPEDALWRNVLLQAIADATLKVPSHEGTVRNQMALIRDQARRYVELQCEDFKQVCELAGLEAGRVHAFAMAQIRQAIEKEHQRTVQDNFVKGSKPGVVENIVDGERDRLTPVAQETAKIDFPEIGN